MAAVCLSECLDVIRKAGDDVVVLQLLLNSVGASLWINLIFMDALSPKVFGVGLVRVLGIFSIAVKIYAITSFKVDAVTCHESDYSWSTSTTIATVNATTLNITSVTEQHTIFSFRDLATSCDFMVCSARAKGCSIRIITWGFCSDSGTFSSDSAEQTDVS